MNDLRPNQIFPLAPSSSSDSKSNEPSKNYRATFSLDSKNEDNDIIKRESVSMSVNVYDVASYILSKLGSISTMKLQKLVYYSQAWSLVWDEEPLFPERIEAWANGPVIPRLFFQHKGFFKISMSELGLGNQNKLNNKQKETIDVVLDYYGNKSAQWLIELSHMEKPWIETRRGLRDGEESNREIPLDLISQYYSSLVNE